MNHLQKRNHLAWFGLLTIIVVTLFASLSVIFLQKSTSEVSFDTRKAAMVNSGLVELDTYPFNQSTLKVKEEQKINLQLNTKNEAIKSIELIFEVIADKGLLDRNKIKFINNTPNELRVSKQEITESLCDQNCFTVTLLLEQKDANTFFNTHNQMATIAGLSFTPQKEGSLKIKISQDSTAIEKTNNTDVLQKPSVLDFQYYVTNNGIDRAQCTYQYTDWGECKNGWQTRNYSVQPDKCYWYDKATLGELSRQCTDKNIINADNQYFYLYSNDRCLNQPSTGESLYVIWNSDKYKNVTYVDVSSSSTFNDFYHKKVDGNIDQTNGAWTMVNASKFTHATGNKGPLSFEPNTTYFFRLYSTDNGGKHIAAVRYYITYCSGDQSSYKNCNDDCSANSDQSKSCAPGLTCYDGACRNQTNPTNEKCLATPGIRSTELSCNQYCASNSDCASGLSCFWNRCRNTQNLESNSCESTTTSTKTSTTNTINKTTTNTKIALLPSEAYDLVTYGCNQGCNSNRDCDADLRCYNGKCRLVDNPENLTCSDTLVTQSQVASSSGSSSSNLNKTNKTTTSTVTPTPQVTNQKANILQSGLNKVLSNFSWQWLALAGVILLIAAVIIVISIAKAKKDPWKNPTATALKNESAPTRNTESVKIPEDKPIKL